MFYVAFHHHRMVFLEWPKQQRHQEDDYSQSKYSRWGESDSVVTAAEKCVFKWRRKVDRDGAEVTSSGKLFQTLAPAIGKARLPTVGRHFVIIKSTSYIVHTRFATLSHSVLWICASCHCHSYSERDYELRRTSCMCCFSCAYVAVLQR